MQYNKLTTAFNSLQEILQWRITNPEAPITDVEFSEKDVPLPYIEKLELPRQLTKEEHLILLLALAPHILPNFLIETVSDSFPAGSEFPIFGGIKGKNHRGILPTGETVLFLFGGNNIEKRLQSLSYFSEEHLFSQYHIITLANTPGKEPKSSGVLTLADEVFQILTTGAVTPPKMSVSFPAKKLETQLTWNDLILEQNTLEDIQELESWLKHKDTILKDWGLANRIKPGYRVLFSGPPGTGKTLTATLLGKYTNRPVYRVDLSTIVSKYIGETEKNLANLFDTAANKDWILFFDEADAIFGKRTQVRDAHDKYANQEVSYLLQRVEDHSGLVILATNLKGNIDEAFTRRFQSICQFKKPGVTERLQLWKTNLPKKLPLASTVDLHTVAENYELTGANIVNIVQYCCLQVLKEKKTELDSSIILRGIKKEFKKENKLL